MARIDAPHSMRERREKVTRLIRECRAANADAVSELATSEGMTLRLIEEGNVGLETFNCHAYALDVYESAEYQALVKQCKTSVLIDKSFMQDLVRHGCLIEKEGPPVRGDLIVYYDDLGRISHSAILVDEDRLVVKSKWGPIQALHRHEIWEVDLAYGDVARVFNRPNTQLILELLKRICEDNS